MSPQDIDKAGQLGDYDTITREQYRRIHSNGDTPRVVLCAYEECDTPLTEQQIKNGGRFHSHRCAGKHTARREYGPTGKPARPTDEETSAVEIVHDLIGDEFDVTTGERNGHGWTPPGPGRHPLADVLLDLVAQTLTHADEWQFAATIGDVSLTLHKEAAS